ncbi:DUF502 domain-containing protein [Alteromonas lipolytica]|uniref:DUF502 domain-containing protein n=1 Tax=Alteromonas lipolytica TaxID=1856405 RepID=A0A1E8FC84_9ALTE|nr:DUF502 domain-containing protein [Alteromonas lipolytica]OFI33113.1 hypothetical protein BFC17_02295 [Alteromonas lipolytica]GGF62368.1 hypothetical protein GCM10011338_13480 [Alteromonas lipolytica]
MFNKLLLLPVKGLLTILPFAITIYFLVWLVGTTEALLSPLLPARYYFPGLGVVTVILALALVGILINAYLFNWIILLGERIFARVPIVKTLFGAVQDAVELFEVKKESDSRKAVAVEINGMKLVGFMTSDKVANKLFPDEDKVAVYLPLSYQIGGYTVYLERDKVTLLDIDVETAMRIAVTGGNSIEKEAK